MNDTHETGTMIGRLGDQLLAFAAGALLAGMVACNSLLAEYSSPLASSLLAHLVGAAVALMLLASFGPGSRHSVSTVTDVPRWAYLGGLPGALTVMLAAVTANGPLALSGTIAFMLVGQLLFGLAVDRFGGFGLPPRRHAWRDLLVALLVLAGSVMLVAGRP